MLIIRFVPTARNGLLTLKLIQRQLIYVNRKKLLYKAYWPVK